MITQEVAKKVIETVQCGLVSGVGVQEPGKMCVEAAVCYALGLPHGDKPKCVSPVLRQLKIRLNDSNWSSNETRADGLLKLSVLQLGTDTGFDEKEFARRVVEMTISEVVPRALRHAASMHPDKKQKQALEDAAKRCEKEKSAYAARSAADAAYAADYAAYYAVLAARAAALAAVNAAAGVADYAAANAAANAAGVAYAAAYAAACAADAAAHAARSEADAADKELKLFAVAVENILIDMNVPGVKFLELIGE